VSGPRRQPAAAKKFRVLRVTEVGVFPTLPANLGAQQSGAFIHCHLDYFNLLCSRTAGFFRRCVRRHFRRLLPDRPQMGAKILQLAAWNFGDLFRSRKLG
jgi:hypothetical protein